MLLLASAILGKSAVDGAVTTRATVAAPPEASVPSEHTTVAVPEQLA